MENGRFTPGEAVRDAVNTITRPWADARLPLPYLSVKEVARTAHIGEGTVINSVLDAGDGAAYLEDLRGQRVNGNWQEAAIASAPRKRVVRQTGPHPADDISLRLGRGRLRINLAASYTF